MSSCLLILPSSIRKIKQNAREKIERKETEAGDAVIPLPELVAQHDPLGGRPVGPLVARLADDRCRRQISCCVRRSGRELLVRCCQKCCRAQAVRRCRKQSSLSYSLESIETNICSKSVDSENRENKERN